MRLSLFLLASLLATGFFAQTPRLWLLEEFTGENCGPCASENPELNRVLAQHVNQKRAVAIKWMVPIPSAPTKTWSLYQTNKAEIDWRYKSAANGGYGYSIPGAPDIILNGESHIWPSTVRNPYLISAEKQTAPFSITMKREWDASLSAVNLTINITATGNYNAVGNLIFRTVMVERLIQFSVAPGGNGETEFEDVAIKSFPTLQGGVAMTANWVPGQTQSFVLNCPVPAHARKKEEIAFVGFIQDDGNKKVIQAARMRKQGLGLNDAEAISVASPGLLCNNQLVPVFSLRNNGTNPITALTITPYLNGSAQAPFNWSGNLESGDEQTVTLPAISHNLSGGIRLSCKITVVSGIDSDPSNNEAVIGFYSGNTNTTDTQVAEDFSGAFPPKGWCVMNADLGDGWAQSTKWGGYLKSTESAVYNLYKNGEMRDRDALYLPLLDLTGTNDPEMTFDLAYSQVGWTMKDTLRIFASGDCGAQWSLLYEKYGTAMRTCLLNFVNQTEFTPTKAEWWRTEQVTLTGFNKAGVMLKFEITNGNGGNLYIDNVNVRQPNSTVSVGELSANKAQIRLYPNPASGLTQADVYAKEPSELSITVVNTIGQVVKQSTIQLQPGQNVIRLDMSDYQAGIYTVIFSGPQSSGVKRLELIK